MPATLDREFRITHTHAYNNSHTHTHTQRQILSDVTCPKANKHQPVFHLSLSLSIFFALVSVGRLPNWRLNWTTIYFYFSLCSANCVAVWCACMCVCAQCGRFDFSVDGTFINWMCRRHTRIAHALAQKKEKSQIQSMWNSILFYFFYPSTAFDVLFQR